MRIQSGLSDILLKLSAGARNVEARAKRALNFLVYNIIRCSRMWRHSHCPSPRSFFLFRQFDSKNCNLADVKPSIKTSPNVPYLFITTFFASYRSGERVMGAFLQPTFSFPSLLFPFVLSVKSFCRPIVLLRFMTSKNGCRSKPL